MTKRAEAQREVGLRSTWLRLEDLATQTPTGACRMCYEATSGALCVVCDHRRARLKARFDHFPMPADASAAPQEFPAPVAAQPVMRRAAAPREWLPYPEDREE